MTIDPFAYEVEQFARVQRHGRPDVAERNRAHGGTVDEARLTDVLAYIERYIAAHVNAPAVREIMAGIGSNSSGSVSGWLEHLVQRGALIRTGKGARSYTTPRALEAVRAAYETASTGGDA